MASIDSYDKAMDLHRYLYDGDTDEKVIERLWHATFSRFLREMGFNRKAVRVMWDTLCNGNWKRLHLTDEEEKRPREKWLEDFDADVFYCSDRWSLDRFVRCHWLWRVSARGY